MLFNHTRQSYPAYTRPLRPCRATLYSSSVLLACGVLAASPQVVLTVSGRTNELKWESALWGRRAPLQVPADGKAGFALMPSGDTGIDFTNHLSDARAAENQIRLNGSGVALGDVDGDGWCDIYLCGLENRNALYRNLGHWSFEDITDRAGVACDGQFSTGAVLVDVDGDGDLDLLVAGIGVGTRLFLNDGKGHFTEATNSGLLNKYGATTMALADIDGDGDLDLYVANYRSETIRSTGMLLLKAGNKTMVRPEDQDRLEVTPEGRIIEFGEPDAFYLNDGNGHFSLVPWTSGRFRDAQGHSLQRPPLDWGLAAQLRDLNGDGAPDLYVCNDFQSEDRIWFNDGHGNFQAAPPLMFRHTPAFSMCVDVADIDRDGLLDIFVADMLSRNHARRLMQLAETAPYRALVGVFEDRPQFDRNALQLNQGDGFYVDIAPFAGLAATEWTWSSAFLDVDLDGFEDLLCTTSHMFDTQDLDAESFIRSKGPWPRERISQKLLLFPKMTQPKQAFRNRGDLTFEDAAARWGFNQEGVGQGMAFADLDNDGDLDVVVNNLNGAAGVYRNNSSAPRVAVRLKGIPPNTRGIGARVSLIAEMSEKGGGRAPARFVQTQHICAGGRYLSSDEPIRVFATDVADALAQTCRKSHPGLPHGKLRLSLEVLWRSGQRTMVEDVVPNSLYEIAEVKREVPLQSPAETAQTKPLFEDVSPRLNHRHHDNLFDDFERQPLLPRKLSQRGPGIAWFDFDGDGHDDLVVGSGRGGQMAIFRGDGHGGFSAVTNAALEPPLSRAQTSVVGVASGSGRGERGILAGASNYEDGQASGSLLTRYDLNAGTVDRTFPGQESSTGPLALADVNGDGTLDLFVGGRCLPGRWPAPATSLVFLNQGGRYQLDPTNTITFANLGLVSGATFADLNGDGWPDLVLACEWGPIRVFLNHRGIFHEATAELGLLPYVGWWNGVVVADFDGDGRLDIAASNWGLNGGAAGYDRPALASNSIDQEQPGVPLIFWGDFGAGSGLGIIEAQFDELLGKVVPTRCKPAMEEGFPSVCERFHSFKAYNHAAVTEVLGEHHASANKLRAPWLASTVFLNRSGKFEPLVLPPEAQFSPAFGICAADFNGDGNEDLVLVQNFFGVQPQAVRCDAGRGLLLLGNGLGAFEPVPGQLSGFRVHGEGRGLAVADFDEDGRPDVAAGQNGAATLLFHNSGGQPGLRVHVSDGTNNPDGVGVQIRLMFGHRMGPLREIHAGGGYWSQSAATQVLGLPQAPDKIWVRWPRGETNVFEIPRSASAIHLTRAGLAP